MKLENLIDYSACHCRIGKPKLIFHDPFCISFLPVRHAVAQRNLVFSFKIDFVQLKRLRLNCRITSHFAT